MEAHLGGVHFDVNGKYFRANILIPRIRAGVVISGFEIKIISYILILYIERAKHSTIAIGYIMEMVETHLHGSPLCDKW